ncbi:hypothetical protein D3C87_1658910 [compost metagenome]
MHENLTHPDDNREFGRTIIDAHASQKFRVGCELCLPVHTQRVVKSRYDKQQPDAWIGNDICQRIQTIVTRPIRYRECAFIKNLDEPRRVAARAYVSTSRQILRSYAQERRASDKFPRMLANGVLTLQYRQRVGGLEQSSKRWLICYCKFRIKFKRRHHTSPL